jgi:hypothetical protein
VWTVAPSSWKTISLLGNNVRIMGCTWLLYSLAVIQPWRVIMGPHDTAAQTNHRTSPVFHCWNQTCWIVSFLGCSSNVNSSWDRKQCEGWLIWPYHTHVCSCLVSRFYGHDTIIYACEHYFQ